MDIRMQTRLRVLILLAVLTGLIFIFRSQLETQVARLSKTYFPCEQPITYSLGVFDARFNISKTTFLDAIAEAEFIWEHPAEKQLFTYSPSANNTLAIHLIYDARQEATDALKKLGLSLKNDQASYDELLARYNITSADYARKKTAYETAVAAFKTRQDAYNAQVAAANARGGARKSEYDRLQEEARALSREIESIHAAQTALNNEANIINVMASSLNHIAQALNLKVSRFNEVGRSQGEEFEEGVYRSGPEGESIDIYQFDTRDKLVRVLAHELGHALGLNHVNDPKAIMYRVNESTNETPTTADLAELKSVCRIE